MYPAEKRRSKKAAMTRGSVPAGQTDIKETLGHDGAEGRGTEKNQTGSYLYTEANDARVGCGDAIAQRTPSVNTTSCHSFRLDQQDHCMHPWASRGPSWSLIERGVAKRRRQAIGWGPPYPTCPFLGHILCHASPVSQASEIRMAGWQGTFAA